MVKKFYLKLKECNLSKNYFEEFKHLFLNRLLSENLIKVLIDRLQVLVLDEIVKKKYHKGFFLRLIIVKKIL